MSYQKIIVNGRIQKAGGVVTRIFGGEPQVYVVHRERYDDWTLPKGHVDEGETPQQAALREVVEETGLACTASTVLPALEYTLPTGEPVKVHFFLMQVEAEGLDTDDEVDEGEWLAVGAATGRLTYPLSRAYLESIQELLSVT